MLLKKASGSRQMRGSTPTSGSPRGPGGSGSSAGAPAGGAGARPGEVLAAPSMRRGNVARGPSARTIRALACGDRRPTMRGVAAPPAPAPDERHGAVRASRGGRAAAVVAAGHGAVLGARDRALVGADANGVVPERPPTARRRGRRRAPARVRDRRADELRRVLRRAAARAARLPAARGVPGDDDAPRAPRARAGARPGSDRRHAAPRLLRAGDRKG